MTDLQNAQKFFRIAYGHLMTVKDPEAKKILAYAIGIGIEFIKRKEYVQSRNCRPVQTYSPVAIYDVAVNARRNGHRDNDRMDPRERGQDRQSGATVGTRFASELLDSRMGRSQHDHVGLARQTSC